MEFSNCFCKKMKFIKRKANDKSKQEILEHILREFKLIK